nr:uncharacterized protein LOC114107968 isoform X1 [Marmota flaviventris]
MSRIIWFCLSSSSMMLLFEEELGRVVDLQAHVWELRGLKRGLLPPPLQLQPRRLLCEGHPVCSARLLLQPCPPRPTMSDFRPSLQAGPSDGIWGVRPCFVIVSNRSWMTSGRPRPLQDPRTHQQAATPPRPPPLVGCHYRTPA